VVLQEAHLNKMMNDVKLAEIFFEDVQKLKIAIHRRIVGQDLTIELMLNALFCQGHCLLVGVPGLAKTRLVHAISTLVDLDFKRIQFTPDLMPSDIIGSEILDAKRNFVFKPGPVFTNLVLADEINRTPPKTQSALLEAMQEETVSVAGTSFELPKPFLVFATQNPIEQEGTYPLPEAQLDRFLFMIKLEYPSFADEINVVRMTEQRAGVDGLKPLMSLSQLLSYQDLIRRVPVSDHVVEAAVTIVHKTRPNSEMADVSTKEYVTWGAGPRASQNLILAAKCRSLMHGRYSPKVEDVKEVAVAVLQHRIILSYKAESQGFSAADIIEKIIS
jgi:MoxR-like ATPase